MKVAITGHSQGIGKAIFEEMTKRNHAVVGFSRSNGYDISQDDVRTQILEEIKDFDVFVNNAYCPNAQFNFLKEITDAWEGSQKVIVHIGSKSIFAPDIIESMESYVEDKKLQNEFIAKRKLRANPHIVNLILGLVDTEMSKVFSARKISSKDLGKFVADVIELQDKMYIQELILDVAYQDWKDISISS